VLNVRLPLHNKTCFIFYTLLLKVGNGVREKCREGEVLIIRRKERKIYGLAVTTDIKIQIM
jgi:hypothetical protein